jgi:hypothetical protein
MPGAWLQIADFGIFRFCDLSRRENDYIPQSQNQQLLDV